MVQTTVSEQILLEARWETDNLETSRISQVDSYRMGGIIIRFTLPQEEGLWPYLPYFIQKERFCNTCSNTKVLWIDTLPEPLYLDHLLVIYN